MPVTLSSGVQSDIPTSIVFIHGFLDNRSVWSSLIARLGSEKRKCYALDLRGAGAQQAESEGFTLEQAAADFVNLIETHRLYNVVLVGHSMGGQIAELVALKVADRIAAIVLLTPVTLAGGRPPPDAEVFLRNCGGNADTQREIRRQFSSNLCEEEIDRLVSEDVIMGTSAVEGYFDAFSDGHPSGREPISYLGPLLIIAAQDDPVVPMVIVEEMANTRFPGKKLERIDNSGHWPHLERPDDTAEVIERFLSENAL
jgi:pimeloyl-ACP methyl ester carboxylesterase